MAVQQKHIPALNHDIIYPDSDGKPMFDNTLQALWIIMLYDNLRALFFGQEVLIAADLFWYPVEGNPNIKVAPDVLVALDRPDAYRGSYKQWQENNQPPQVVVEVLSPSNSTLEMLDKLDFYERHGVSEFMLIDPEKNEFIAYQSEKGKLLRADKVGEIWKSPLLGIQFQEADGKLTVSNPDGTPFKTFAEVKAEKDAAETAKHTAMLEVERLKARLRELGESSD